MWLRRLTLVRTKSAMIFIDHLYEHLNLTIPRT